MIVISGALVVIAGVLLVAGFVANNLTFIYAAIGLSVVSGLFLLFGILQPQPPQRAPRQGERRPGGDAPRRRRRPEGEGEGQPRRRRPDADSAGGGERSDTSDKAGAATQAGDDAETAPQQQTGSSQQDAGAGSEGHGKAAAGAAAAAAGGAAVAAHEKDGDEHDQHDQHDEAGQAENAEHGNGEQDRDGHDGHDEQSRSEDPFAGEPDVEQVAPDVAEAAASSGQDVHVVSGHPRYHLEHCSVIVGDPELEPIEIGEAKELGFTPCAVCAPDSHLGAGSGPASDASGQHAADTHDAPPADEVGSADGRHGPAHGAVAAGAGAATVGAVAANGRAPSQEHADHGQASAAPDEHEHDEPRRDEQGYAPASASTATAQQTEQLPAQPVEQVEPVRTEQPPSGTAQGHAMETAPPPASEPVAEPTAEPVPTVVAAQPESVPAAAQPVPTPTARAKSVVTVSGRSDYHRAECPLIEGQEQDSLSRVAAIRQGYFACSNCKP